MRTNFLRIGDVKIENMFSKKRAVGSLLFYVKDIINNLQFPVFRVIYVITKNTGGIDNE